MNNDFQGIIANDELCSYFATAIKSGSLSHAYILHGARGTGKHTLSYLLAAAINCENKSESDKSIPCCKCNSCKKILGKISPDVNLVSREDDRATLGIAPIRKIREDVTFFPIDGAYKVYIIEDAHTMTTQAQNALLLTLEEPPSYAIFILLCEDTESLLETIKSRAPILRMKTPSEDQTVAFLKENHPPARTFINTSPDEFKQIYKASGGSIGRILELIGSTEKKQILQNRSLAEQLMKAIADHSLATRFSEINSMFAQKREDRDKLISQLCEIQSAVRDLMVLKKADEPQMIFFTDVEYAEELSYSFSTQKLTQIYESAEKARIALLRNANVKLTVVNFLSGLI
jgi:DNA polymerase-3 subunit delta'